MIRLQGHTLTPGERIDITDFALNIMERQSSASIITRPDMPDLQVGEWLLDDTEPGKGMVWRIKIKDGNLSGRQNTYTMEHVIQLLRDTSIFGEVKPGDITGNKDDKQCTARQAAQFVLSKQSVWALGDFDYDMSAPFAFNGDDLYSALEKITSALSDPCWEYDLSSLPFKLHIRHKTTEEESEMRMGRNIATLRTTVDRSQTFTRVYPIGKKNLKLPEEYLSRNEQLWGRRDKVITDQSQETEEALRIWAQDYLDRHCEPLVTITVGGLDLSRATGEALDKLTINRVCRAPLPEYDTYISERITKLSYKNKIKEPENVTVTLCNVRQDIASILSQQAAGGGGGARAAAKEAEEDHAWFVDTESHVGMVAEAIIGRDADGVNWSRVSEIIVDGTGIHQAVVAAQGSLVTAFGRLDMNEESLRILFQRTDDIYGQQIMTAESLTTIFHGLDDIYGQQIMTAESLTTLFHRTDDIYGQQIMTAESLTTIFHGLDDIYGQQTMTAESLTTLFSQTDDLYGQQVMTRESLSTLFYKTGVNSLGQNETLYGKVTETAESLTAEYTRATEAEGSLSGRIAATAESLTVEYTRATEAEGLLSSRITATAESLTSKVSAGEIASVINQTAQSVLIQANKIDLSGYVSMTDASAVTLAASTLTVNGLNCTGDIDAQGIRTDEVLINGVDASTAIAGFGTAVEANGQITIPTTTLAGTAGPDINFNIAATQCYIDGVAAAKNAVGITGSWSQNTFMASTTGQDSAHSKVATVSVGNVTYANTALNPNDSRFLTVTIPATLTGGGDSSTSFANITVDATKAYQAGAASVTPAVVSVSKGTWNGGDITFSPSSGSGSSAGVSLNTTVSWGQTAGTINRATVMIYDGSSYTGEYAYVDASARYTAGQNSVTIAAADIETNGSLSWDGSGATYPASPSSFNVTVPVKATASNGEYNTQSLTYYAGGFWENGRLYGAAQAVCQSVVVQTGGTITFDRNTRTATVPVTSQANVSGYNKNTTLEVDMSSVLSRYSLTYRGYNSVCKWNTQTEEWDELASGYCYVSNTDLGIRVNNSGYVFR